MGYATLTVDHRATQLELAPNHVVVVRYHNEPNTRVGLHALKGIIVTGSALLSASLLRACGEHEVGLMILSGRSRTPPISILPMGGIGRRIRHAQYRAAFTATPALDIARRVVLRKLESQEFRLGQHGLTARLETLKAKIPDAATIATLMGIEGAATARYFDVWRGLWDTEWAFMTRNRRPPRDPVNSMLSLGYILAGQYVGSMAVQHGLDPTIGFLHRPEPSRNSLALDLLEPLRAVVDAWVLQHAQQGDFKPSDFTNERDFGCRLSKEARAQYFERWFVSENDWYRQQARAILADVLTLIRQCRSPQVPTGADTNEL